jgi:hypothetical protein
MWHQLYRAIFVFDLPWDFLPWWVWAFLIEYWLLFWCFPITMVLQYSQWGRYENSKYPLLKNGGYLAGERTYIWLSFISKTLIIWQLGGAAFEEERSG